MVSLANVLTKLSDENIGSHIEVGENLFLHPLSLKELPCSHVQKPRKESDPEERGLAVRLDTVV